jgi:putative restriction endonuclease
MRGFIANTDWDWFRFLRAARPPVREVNFWKPGAQAAFKALQPGEPILFKLKAPRNAIAGFSYFAHYSTLPVSMAWEIYAEANGAPSFMEMRARLAQIRSRFDMEVDPHKDFWIGCILVHEPVFFEEQEWIERPGDWSGNIVQGKGYDLTSGEGKRIWDECRLREAAYRQPVGRETVPLIPGGYGAPSLILPRLGQKSFRVAVLDSYQRRCSVTGERTLPVLEAAHIKGFAEVQEHAISNGILLRADIHKLFDTGYVTVTPEHRFLVSRKIKEEFENGKDYYRLHGSEIRLPARPEHAPASEALGWHNEKRFLG